MQIIEDIDALRQHLWDARLAGKSVAFVPTMGNLHEGHMQLIDQALTYGDVVVASIFVNPLQFGPGEDFASYPRTLEHDVSKLQARGCHVLFTPSVEGMYPQTKVSATVVNVPHLSERWCGLSRPLFFTGVATVVAKLFGIVQPDYAVFGLKDYQQYCVIKQMTADLCLPVEIIGAPIARASSGLALSSRNGYLSDQELATAASLYACLTHLRDQIVQGNKDFKTLAEQGQSALEQVGFIPDYLEICRQKDLQPAQAEDTDMVIAAAAFLGKARLIDNIQFTLL